MKRVTMKNCVPEVYTRESRDFQLLCDLFDLVNSGVKFDIDTITSLSDTQFCRDSMLRLLQGKLGLNLKNNITDSTLRKILKCFPFIIRHKGTRQGIEEMIHLFLNIIYSEGSYSIEIENKSGGQYNEVSNGSYVVAIVTTVASESLKELDILDDLLSYIIPTGYKVDYSLNIASPAFESKVLSSDTVYVTVIDEREENRMRSSTEDADYINSSLRKNLHSVGAIVAKVSDTEKANNSINEGKTFGQIFNTDSTYVEREISDEEESLDE